MQSNMIELASLISRNRANEQIGIPCFCTANEQVLHSILQYAQTHQVPAVIEATCNQVNQEGGYTGMTAANFHDKLAALAKHYNVESDAIILGGDHLGPNPWRHLPANEAMDKADVLVKDYAAAGFRKIHLDASMACGGEPTPSFELVAERAARLCKIVESYSPCADKLIYIIGTEVPIPGGEIDDMEELTITGVDRLTDTIDTHREAFEKMGLAHVWSKIASVVAQPGVDFSHTAVHRFEPEKSLSLATSVMKFSDMTFEAHSTDYQPTDALAELVSQHFFFLKVGPELTFRFREAVFALVHIEERLVSQPDRSDLIAAIDRVMHENTAYWAPYYKGDSYKVQQLKHFSYSDRIRYYWTNADVQSAFRKLILNLSKRKIPETLVSQYFPEREFGSLNAPVDQILFDHISMCTNRYYSACGFG